MCATVSATLLGAGAVAATVTGTAQASPPVDQQLPGLGPDTPAGPAQLAEPVAAAEHLEPVQITSIVRDATAGATSSAATAARAQVAAADARRQAAEAEARRQAAEAEARRQAAAAEARAHAAAAQPAVRLASATTSATAAAPAALPGGGAGMAALQAATAQIGKPYVWGATGPNAFDCSGLTQWAFRQAGVTLPRTAAEQATVGTPVSQDQLRPGDLVFFYSPISHVGIYVGNGQVLAAPEPGETVKYSNMAYMPFNSARRL